MRKMLAEETTSHKNVKMTTHKHPDYSDHL